MWLDQTNQWLGRVADMADDMRGFDAVNFFSNALTDFGQNFSRWLSGAINQVFGAANAMDANALGQKIGITFARLFDNDRRCVTTNKT